MPAPSWRSSDDLPEATPHGTPSPRRHGPPRVRVLTRGLAAAVLATFGGLCYVFEGPPASAPVTASREGLSGHVQELTFADRGRLVAALAAGGSLTVWDPATDYHTTLHVGRSGHTPEVSFTPDGSRLAVVADRDAQVIVWDVAASRALAVLPLRDRDQAALAFRHDGSGLAAADRTGIRIWELDSTGPRIAFEHALADVRTLAFSPDRRTLAIGVADGTIRLCDTARGTERIISRGHLYAPAVLIFTPDGSVLASSVYPEKTAEVWDVATARRLAVLEAGSTIVAMAFSPEERVLALACMDGQVKLWDAPAGRPIKAIEVADTSLTAVAFSPDGRDLACGLHGRVCVVPLLVSPAPAS